MNNNLKKAYWDLKMNSNVGLYQIEKSIFELKEIIKNCVPNKKRFILG